MALFFQKSLFTLSLFIIHTFGYLLVDLKGKRYSLENNSWEELKCPEQRNGLFSHPKYCDRYLNCWGGQSPVEGRCEHALFFNQNSSSCDYPRNVDCDGKVDSRPQKGEDGRCKESYGTFPVESNCSQFVVCQAGIPILFECTQGLAYDPMLGVCRMPEDPTCLEQPLEQTTTEPTLLPPMTSVLPPAMEDTDNNIPDLNPDLIQPSRPKPPSIPNFPWPSSSTLLKVPSTLRILLYQNPTRSYQIVPYYF